MRRFTPIAMAVVGLMAAAASPSNEYQPSAQKPAAVALFEQNWMDAARSREVPVRVFYPQAVTGKCPVVIFSHGLGGNRESYGYLGRYWAARGYVAVHLQHHGSDTPALLSDGLMNVARRGGQIAADVNNAADRAIDVSFAIDQLKKLNDDPASALHGRLDLDRIGLAGHSFGGNTALMIAGQNFGPMQADRRFADPRVKAIVSMSPPIIVKAADYDRSFKDVTVPTMVLTGTEDNAPIGKTANEDRQAAFKSLDHGPAYLVTLTGGDHLVFSGTRFGRHHPADDDHYDLIRSATTAMFDAYLKDDPAARRWLDASTGLSDYSTDHHASAVASDPTHTP